LVIPKGLDLSISTSIFTKNIFLDEKNATRQMISIQIAINQSASQPLNISKQKNNHPSFSCPQARKAV
jgi:hypothetical protein